MADRILLIPGTSGNKLLLDDGKGEKQDIGWPGALKGKAWLCSSDILRVLTQALGLSAEQIVETLSMEFGDPQRIAPTRSTLRKGALMEPGAVIQAPYNQFSSARSFCYDWRSDIRDSASKLVEFLLNTPPGPKWKIVTHSQGGLVLIVAAKMLGRRAGGDDTEALSRYVSHADLVACPIYGTANAADALVNGTNLGGGFSQSFLKVSRTWPALYQMLPAWSKFAFKDGRWVSALDDATWQGRNLDPALLQRARDLRNGYLKTPLAFFGRVALRLTMSRAHPTHNSMTIGDTGMATAGNEPGDTLVPYDTTYQAMTSIERRATYVLGAVGAQNTAEHFMVLNDPVIATDVRRFFAQ